MKILSTTLFIILIGLICLTQTTLSQCLEYDGPVYRYKTKVVECPMISSKDKRQLGPGNPEQPPAPPAPPQPQPPQPPASEPPASPPSEPAQPSPDNMFTINFDCPIADQVLCKKVDDVFITAGNYITEAINLKQPITVSAKFYDFCAVDGECGANGKIVLGAAGPSRIHPHQGPNDDKMRIYPQALYKQLDLPDHQEYGPDDIQAVFNANIDYWFVGDPEPMPITQVDILYVVLHELVHGLGFTSSWRDYANIQALTPFFASSFTNSNQGQFVEIIFDKQLVFIPSGEMLTSKTDELNQFQFTVDMSDAELIQSFQKSPQFAIAQEMYAKATTQGSMGFLLTTDLPPNTQLTPEQIQNDVVILETSFSPLAQGSSISHVDEITYKNSSDFLMMAEYPKQATLNMMMANAGTTNTTGPIGPQLRRILEIMGYEIKNSTSDSSSPTSVSTSTPTDSASDNSSNSSASASNTEINFKTAFIVSTILAGIFASILLSLCSLFLIKKYNNKKQRATDLTTGSNSITPSSSDIHGALQVPKETYLNRGRDVNNSMKYNIHNQGREANHSPTKNYYINNEVVNNLPSNIANRHYINNEVVNNLQSNIANRQAFNNSAENLTNRPEDINNNSRENLTIVSNSADNFNYEQPYVVTIPPDQM